MDLITGAPLLRDIDLQLPFGGAVYRHVRTYGEGWSSVWHENEALRSTLDGTVDQTPVRKGVVSEELFWDWHGQGWMIGENPMFLFDAEYLGIGAVPAHGSVPVQTKRMCYFIPDAHRSIPFERQEAPAGQTPKYVAPPQFDAAMRVNGGSWNGSDWTAPPTSVDVVLHQGAVRYHIELQLNTQGSPTEGADVPRSTEGHSLHNSYVSATSPGMGMPYWGLTTRIEDRVGNRILLEHAPFQQYFAEPEETSGEYCKQNSNERGQLKAIRLVAAGSADNQPTWTIVVVHRSFHANDPDLWWTATEPDPIPDPPGLPEGYERNPPNYTRLVGNTYLARTFQYHRQNAIHAMIVYAGSVSVPAGSLTIDAGVFSSIGLQPNGQWNNGPEILDKFDALDPVAMFGLSDTNPR